VKALWRMQNGYALCNRDGLKAITRHLGALHPTQLDDLRGKLCIGLHRDVDVTEAPGEHRPNVSQAFCSALPVGSTSIPSEHWESFALLILQAAYEATLWAAVLNAQRGTSNVVLLTLLGGGAFGNEENWIYDAMRQALGMFSGFNINVKLVSYRTPSRQLLQLAGDFDKPQSR
jgi:hypothetical protein